MASDYMDGTQAEHRRSTGKHASESHRKTQHGNWGNYMYVILAADTVMPVDVVNGYTP